MEKFDTEPREKHYKNAQGVGQYLDTTSMFLRTKKIINQLEKLAKHEKNFVINSVVDVAGFKNPTYSHKRMHFRSVIKLIQGYKKFNNSCTLFLNVWDDGNGDKVLEYFVNKNKINTDTTNLL